MADNIENTTKVNCAVNELRLDNLEKDVESIKKDIDEIYNNHSHSEELLIKLNSFVEYMVEDRKDQKSINEKHVTTLEKMNENLIHLNNDVKYLMDDNVKINSQLKQTQEKSTIDWIELFNNAFKYLLKAGITTGIIYVLYEIVNKQ